MHKDIKRINKLMVKASLRGSNSVIFDSTPFRRRSPSMFYELRDYYKNQDFSCRYDGDSLIIEWY